MAAANPGDSEGMREIAQFQRNPEPA